MQATKMKSKHGTHKNILFQTRFTPEIYERIRDRAAREGLSMALWVRRLVMLELAKQPERDLRDLLTA